MCVSKLSVLSLLSIVSVVVSAVNTIQASQTNWQAKRQLSDSATRRRPEFIYYEEKVPEYTLPELLVAADRTKVTSAKTWRTSRRAEILERQSGSIPNSGYQSPAPGYLASGFCGRVYALRMRRPGHLYD